MYRGYIYPCKKCGKLIQRNDRLCRKCWVIDPKERFSDKFEKTNLCWLWKKGFTKDGYGRFTIGKKPFQAHRYSYEIYKGEIPLEKYILHKCDNPPCVNPEHLFIGTPKDNFNDAIKKGRVNVTGEYNGGSKLTKKEVLEIREKYSSPSSIPTLAKIYGVGRTTIYRIIQKTHWKHI